MKKLRLLFLSVVALALTTVSCSKNDPPADPMTGLWKFDKYTYTKDGTTSSEADYTDPTCQDKDFFDLKSPGVLQLGSVDLSCVLTKLNGSWKHNNGILHIEGSGINTLDFPVVSVTPTKLTLKYVNPSDVTEFYTFTLLKK